MSFSNDNEFCKPEDNDFRRWDMMDYTIYKYSKDDPVNYGGKYYLFLYKDTFVKFHRNRIIQYANDAKIPPFLLASVAWQEAGGKPDNLKPQVLLFRQVIDLFRRNNDYSNSVSIGIVAMQIRVVAEILKVDPGKLSMHQQLQISRCLQSDDFNLKMAALHLHDLILYDYHNADTTMLNDEEIILVGARYNRGIKRKKEDFISAISLPQGDHERDYISYGLAIIKRRDRLRKLLEDRK